MSATTANAKSVQCIDVNGKKYDTPISSLQWRPAAYAIVIHDNHILLLRQFGNTYELPGGGLDLGEDPKSAVLREVREETGINVTHPVSLGVESCLYRSAHSDDKAYHSLLMYFGCSYIGGDISTHGWDEHESRYVNAVEWVPLDSLSSIRVGSTVDFRPYIAKAKAIQPTT